MIYSPAMRVLSVSDQILEFIYSPDLAKRFGHVDLVLGCGDLPYYYLEFIVDALNKPVYYVRGNHATAVEYSQGADRREPWGAIDLHRKVVNYRGLLIAGFEGCVRYRVGPYMYSQAEMWRMVLGIVPRLLYNRLRYGRALDVLVTHTPPWHVQDAEDPAHQGFKAFRWLLKVFKVPYQFHGHIHLYDGQKDPATHFNDTLVTNTYGYRETELEIPQLKGKTT